MKKTLVTLFATVLLFTACTNTDQKEIDRQDSIKEAATADSMLNSAIEADSLIQDTLRVDSIITKPTEQR
jgi:predicted component of type VI protein secretion system